MVPSDSFFVNGDSSLQLTKALVIRSHPLAPLFIDKVSWVFLILKTSLHLVLIYHYMLPFFMLSWKKSFRLCLRVRGLLSWLNLFNVPFTPLFFGRFWAYWSIKMSDVQQEMVFTSSWRTMKRLWTLKCTWITG